MTRYYQSYVAYTIVASLLSLFILYMLHGFSIFKGTVTDPITGKEIPVLCMFLTAKALEKGLEDRVLSDIQRAKLKKLMDQEEGEEMFRASEISTSIAVSFIGNNIRDSMTSLLKITADGPARHSEASSLGGDDDLEGEALQMVLKGKPIPGSLGDENY